MLWVVLLLVPITMNQEEEEPEVDATKMSIDHVGKPIKTSKTSDIVLNQGGLLSA